jgi:hypothetical protein
MAVAKFVEDIVSLLGLTKEKTKELTKLAKKFYDTVKAEKAGAKKAKGAKKSDSDVKRPLNAYLSFSGAVRKQVKEVNPSMNPKELTAEIAKQWNEEKEANTETYQKYADKAAKDLEEYKKTKSEKSESEAGSGSESDSEKPEKKKRAPSAYNVFYSLKYAEFSSKGMSAADAKKEISEVWGKLTPEEKEEYKGKELSPKKTKPAEKKSAAKPAADAKAADAKAADAAKATVKKTKTADAKAADAKAADAAKDATAKPEKKTAKAEKAAEKADTKKDDTKPKKAKKAEEVTEDEEEDIDLDAFDDAPPPKKNAAKKDVPK